MKTIFTKQLAKLLRAIDTNTRGIAKLVSGEAHVCEYNLGGSAELAICLDILVRDRRQLKQAFEAELSRQANWVGNKQNNGENQCSS